MAPIFSELWEASSQFFRATNLQIPLEGAPLAHGTLDVAQKAATHASSAAADSSSFRGGPQIAGIDLVAMLVSDSGLASTEPVWWNTSPLGCLLLGLQPRGGWQVIQRSVQWGHDAITKSFGVNCTMPALYAYFTCSVRNRIEVWDSPQWRSPMQDGEESGAWAQTAQSFVSRPTKLLDGSRGGQAFISEILKPKEGQHYSIVQQAKMQLLSVLLVAAGLMNDQSLDNFQKVLAEDFAFTNGLGLVFRHLLVGVVVANVILLLALGGLGFHFWGRKIFGVGLPYVVELTSIASWAIGATGLLMQGGNPRVLLSTSPLPTYVQERLDGLIHEAELGIVEEVPKVDSHLTDEKKALAVIEEVSPVRTRSVSNSIVKIQFGSLHGSVFLQDKGYAYISPDVVRFICSRTFQFQRPWQWYSSMLWCALLLVISIALQVVGTHTATTGSVIVGVIILLSTSVLRGTGISGPEEWQIPAWKRRKGTNYGAALQGAYVSR